MGESSARISSAAGAGAVPEGSSAKAAGAAGHAVFETALGFFGIAWSAAGLARLCLPQASREAVQRRLLRLEGVAEDRGARPRWVERLIAGIRDYAEGRQVDFADVPVDLSGVDDFRLAIYAAARALAYGETTTYGELAKRAGHSGLPRETGAALGANPVPLVIPCHRILAAGGRIGGFSAPGGSASKERMLALEGVQVGPPPPAQASFGF
ncbi:methylated-DNA--[protein]-cysteine S-methyltransferase [Mesorhizobium sp. SP-1A]|uniref:methylated-DNA--[protein]-cysteine S-methyltransferase n=1 Tax=Mesorhizobium sp. SP-1A TaxID=3077840 RepID=UPI0028F6D506|nr:methylated-DNA--[protein]-cysteine S-methyltransferase [Mesorhizobium sp. SP-1A]